MSGTISSWVFEICGRTRQNAHWFNCIQQHACVIIGSRVSVLKEIMIQNIKRKILSVSSFGFQWRHSSHNCFVHQNRNNWFSMQSQISSLIYKTYWLASYLCNIRSHNICYITITWVSRVTQWNLQHSSSYFILNSNIEFILTWLLKTNMTIQQGVIIKLWPLFYDQTGWVGGGFIGPCNQLVSLWLCKTQYRFWR